MGCQAGSTPGVWGNECLGPEWGLGQHTAHLLKPKIVVQGTDLMNQALTQSLACV